MTRILRICQFQALLFAAAYLNYLDLQMVRHFWEQNGIKGAISSVAKLPDYSVGIPFRPFICWPLRSYLVILAGKLLYSLLHLSFINRHLSECKCRFRLMSSAFSRTKLDFLPLICFRPCCQFLLVY